MTQTQAVHIRHGGKSYDTNLEELSLSDAPSDSDLKNAVSRHLDIASTEVNDYVVERTTEGNLVLRPNAPFG